VVTLERPSGWTLSISVFYFDHGGTTPFERA